MACLARRLLDEAGAEDGGHRRVSLVLSDGTLLRDQAPMPPAALARCLVGGITPGEWYTLLNSRVFFWCDHARLERQGRACAPRPQLVLTLDTACLLARHGARTALTPFNTGFARRQPAPRGRDTFVPYTVWLETGWTSEAAVRGNGKIRPLHHAPVELVIADAVPDVLDLVLEAQPL